MKKFILFFNRKYPFFISTIWSIIFISIGISLIILILKPFGFINYEGSKVVASIGFGVLTFTSLLFNNFILKKQMKKFTSKWTIFKEILYLIFLLSFISIANFIFFSIIIGDFKLSIIGFLYVIFLTITIAIFPISIITVIRYNRVLKNELGLIISSNDYKNKDIDKEGKMIFSSLNKTEKDFSIFRNNFLFVEAIKNHVHIYYFEDGEVKTKIFRNTLINLTNQIGKPGIYRCHRSFLVNLNNIKTVTGNSNGFKIYFKNYNHHVPVSRSYTNEFKKLIY
ncbi:MAG: LytTR family transcriptional regulator DNA-binding domain-containing protein [Flavobacteriaceae bacterium]|nr:LytTR family transcriptional regulator DNA-binding domain-containing protein [Flavobacteriaceae bacterium]